MDIDIKNKRLGYFAKGATSQIKETVFFAEIIRSPIVVFLASILFWSSILFLISLIFLPAP